LSLSLNFTLTTIFRRKVILKKASVIPNLYGYTQIFLKKQVGFETKPVLKMR